MIFLNGKPVRPTMFPDGTSQVWKLDEPISQECVITWEFENEGEVIHVAQLVTLLKTLGRSPQLNIPFLPYGRQDKGISNHSTFALRVFAEQIQAMGFARISTLDAHSDVFLKLAGAENVSPKELIYDVLVKTRAQVVALPDHGASLRYDFPGWPTITGQKERDALTGSLLYNGLVGCDVAGKTVLIVDDICDGGMTFILFAKLLYGAGAKDVQLWTTHGIYSKGIQVLKDAGISRIFNRKGEVT